MAWDTSDRRARLPSDWPQRRAIVLKRDGYQCVATLVDGPRCPEPGTDVDHIVPGDNHDVANLQTLCAWHHRRKTAREAAAARASRPRPSVRRAERPHPGDL
ncbi:HNH endonuclease signature motif containing protein [Streptomyces sp. NPDC045470]|uniref:HNH endonuclease n=1 Tax=Streptomyces sp. NPDC045470 TaxID=3155469 RepID=UPI0033C42EA5